MTTEATVRASSWGDLFDCSARWAGKYLGQRTGGKPPPDSGRAYLGTAIHHGTAVYDRQRIGLPKAERGQASVDDAADAFVETIQKPDREVAWQPDLTKKSAETIGLLLVGRYCNDISQRYSFEHVEQQCTPLDISVGNVNLHITGTNDRVQQQLNLRGIIDLKSGARIMRDGKVNVTPHVYQLGTYELTSFMAERDTGMEYKLPAEIVGLPTSGDMIPEVGIVRNPSKVLYGEPGKPGLLEAAAAILKAGIFPGNPRSSLCSQTWCPVFKSCRWRGDTDL